MDSQIINIKSLIDKVPQSPGVYLWKNADGDVIYVGKAKRLRDRMRQYINLQDSREKIPMLVSEIASFEYVVVANETESLILEKQLIDMYKPFFNADFKDDKSYPFIALTTGDVFPAIKYTREKHRPETTYFGPYTDSRAARRMVDVVRKIVPICSAGCSEWRRLNRNTHKGEWKVASPDSQSQNCGEDDPQSKLLHSLQKNKPCFDCHVGLGPGACCGRITPQAYAENIRTVARFLNGKQNEFLFDLCSQMQEAADNLDFERAERLKGRIDVINATNGSQNIISDTGLDADIIGFFAEDKISGVYVIIVREGRIINTNEFVLDKGRDVPIGDLTHNFMLRYYSSTTQIPREVILASLPDESEVTEEWLTQKLASKHGAKVRLVLPARGDKLKLLQMAQQNAKHALMRYKVKTSYDDKRTNTALLQLESALSMQNSPLRIECFDISTIHGSYTVASMVVFSAGKADKSQYRRFKIKTPLEEANDFLSMQEVLSRRYSAERMCDARFGECPDLILLDGGRPQLSAAIEIFEKIGFAWQERGVALAGLAKSDEELVVPMVEGEQPASEVAGNANESKLASTVKPTFYDIRLPDGSASLYLVKQVRDEAHRFAITFHRELRGKGMTRSLLDTVPGIGPTRKKRLLKHFGSMKKLREASLEEIIESKTLPLDVAKELHLILHQESL